jgi:hypothetical protein
MEAALNRRLDGLTRQLEKMEHQIIISNEALALFVRFWLTTTPALPLRPEVATSHEGFVEALGRRLAQEAEPVCASRIEAHFAGFVLRLYDIYPLVARRFRNPHLCGSPRFLGSIAPTRSMARNALLRDKAPLNRCHRKKAPDFAEHYLA